LALAATNLTITSEVDLGCVSPAATSDLAQLTA
jgi:hypothetical protein